MPRITGKEVNMSITGTQLLNPSQKAKKKLKENHITFKRVCPREEVLTQEKVIRKYLEKAPEAVRLPAIASRPLRLTSDERYDLQALLRVRCFEFPLHVQQLIPEWTRYRSHSKSSTSSSSCFRRYDRFTTGQETAKEQFPFVVYDNCNNSQEGNELRRESAKAEPEGLKPFKSSILEGQRLNLREKYRIESSDYDFVNRHLKKKGGGKLAP